jgi:hypothetical protein
MAARTAGLKVAAPEDPAPAAGSTAHAHNTARSSIATKRAIFYAWADNSVRILSWSQKLHLRERLDSLMLPGVPRERAWKYRSNERRGERGGKRHEREEGSSDIHTGKNKAWTVTGAKLSLPRKFKIEPWLQK